MTAVDGTDIERVQRAILGVAVTSDDSKAVYNAETRLTQNITRE